MTQTKLDAIKGREQKANSGTARQACVAQWYEEDIPLLLAVVEAANQLYCDYDFPLQQTNKQLRESWNTLGKALAALDQPEESHD